MRVVGMRVVGVRVVGVRVVGVGLCIVSLRAQGGNLVAVATAVRRRVFDRIEIATSLRSSQ